MGLMKNIAASRDFRGFEFKLSQTDVDNLFSKLDKMDLDIKTKIVSQALRAGGKVFIIEAKSRQSVSDRVESGIRGTLRTVKGIKGYIAGPSAGLPNPAWIEYGTLDKYHGFSKKHKASYTVKRTKRFQVGRNEWWIIPGGTVISGGIRPRPFLRPSFEAKYPEMLDKMGKVIEKGLKKYGG